MLIINYATTSISAVVGVMHTLHMILDIKIMMMMMMVTMMDHPTLVMNKLSAHTLKVFAMELMMHMVKFTLATRKKSIEKQL